MGVVMSQMKYKFSIFNVMAGGSGGGCGRSDCATKYLAFTLDTFGCFLALRPIIKIVSLRETNFLSFK